MASAANRLIELLPRKDRLRLLAACETVPLVLAAVLCKPGKAAAHVYFPTKGFISLVAATPGSPGVEVGMIGSEGMLGAHVVLDVVTAPLRALVQGEGEAWRIDMASFRRQLDASAALRATLHRYVYVLMAQLATSSACLRFHQIGPRLARWLLMSQDRAGAASFLVTHEFLSYMLGVRRVGVTVAAGDLQRRGLIEFRRGQFTVIDRAGLKVAACDCYGSDSRAYRAVMRSARAPAAARTPTRAGSASRLK